MQDFIKILIGIAVLVMGFFIGNLLAKSTKEELKSGQKWFGIIIILTMAGAIVGLAIGNDILLFTFLFVTIITSRSIKKKNKKDKN